MSSVVDIALKLSQNHLLTKNATSMLCHQPNPSFSVLLKAAGSLMTSRRLRLLNIITFASNTTTKMKMLSYRCTTDPSSIISSCSSWLLQAKSLTGSILTSSLEKAITRSWSWAKIMEYHWSRMRRTFILSKKTIFLAVRNWSIKSICSQSSSVSWSNCIKILLESSLKFIWPLRRFMICAKDTNSCHLSIKISSQLQATICWYSMLTQWRLQARCVLTQTWPFVNT